VRYDGFGDVLTESNPSSGDRYKYTGREADVGGLLFLRDRVLDLGSGRFLTRDRMGFAAGDANLTRYVGNGFTNGTDPSGFDKWYYDRRSPGANSNAGSIPADESRPGDRPAPPTKFSPFPGEDDTEPAWTQPKLFGGNPPNDSWRGLLDPSRQRDPGIDSRISLRRLLDPGHGIRVGQRRPTTLLEDAASQLALVTVKSEDGTIIESGVRPKKQAMERAEALQSGVEPRSKGEVLAMMGLDSLGLAASVAGGVLIGWTGVGLAPAVIGAGLSADSLQSHMRELIDGKPHDTIVAGVAKEIGGLFTEDERDLDRIGRGADTGANLLNLGMAMKSLIQAAPKLWQGARTTFELRGGFFPGMRGMTAGGALAMEAGAPLIRVSVNTGAVGEMMLAGTRCVTSMVTIEVRPLMMARPTGTGGGGTGGGSSGRGGGGSGGTGGGGTGRITPGDAESMMDDVIASIVLKRGASGAGFTGTGKRVIVDSNLPPQVAAELRAKGYDARHVNDIFDGVDPRSDPPIRRVAEAFDAHVLTKDRGRDLNGGFGNRGIKVDGRVDNVDTMVRILIAHLGKP